ncbi:MAG: Hsp70 family protein [Acidobacteria bacterium]|nr:MAG: Hsp70 family protein [Acidobacteriota bacterium]
MNHRNPRVIYGIDLGTTFSAIAYVNPNGEPICVPLRGEEEFTIPSAVLFVEQNEVYVGAEAINNSWREGSVLVEFAKRDIGLQNGLTWRFAGWEYTAEEISALILRKIVQQLSQDRRMSPVRDVVITHPQYFYMNQKEATREAGELAGLNVVATITEPNAAAIAYGLAERATTQDCTILVFDLGGGTFDVTLMRVGEERVEMLGSDGDARLGGMDWDREIVELAKQEFAHRSGEDFDSVASPEERIRLRKAAERAKMELSRADRDRYRLFIQAGGYTLPLEISRAEFEGMCRYLVERCIERCERLFQQTGYNWAEIDEILLVGNSTKMSMIQEELRRISGREPRIDEYPKLMVAKGAAIWGYWVREGRTDARWVTPEEEEPSGLAVAESPQVSGRTAHGLGVLARMGGRDRIRILIPQNTPTPHAAEETFYTIRDNATAILVRLYEGESENPNACCPIGQILIEDLPPRPEGQPVRVKFEIDHSGRMQVEVTDIRTGRTTIKEINRDLIRPLQGISFEDRRRHLSEIIVR